MDPRRTIKKYISTSPVIKAIALICALLTALFLVLALVNAQGKTSTVDPKTVAKQFDAVYNEEDSFAYLDVIGVSECLMDDCYMVEDEEYFYLVRLTEDQFAEMGDLLTYWNRDTEDVPVPEAQRFYGKVDTISYAMITMLSTGFDLSQDDVTSLFGTLLLDCTADLSPTTVTEEGDFEMWLVFALMAGIFALVFGIVALTYNIISNKHLNRLEQLGLLEKAAMELELESNQQVNKDQARLSPSFVFGKGSGFVARYEDITWCYRKNVRTNLIFVNSFLYIGTRFGTEQSLTSGAISDKYNAFQQTAGMIAQKNPNVMFGYTSKNRKAHKQLVKAEKENGIN